MKRKFFCCAFIFYFSLFLAPVLAQNQWNRQSPLPQPRDLTGAEWVSPSHGFITGRAKTFFETLDGGQTWRRISLAGGDSTDPFYNVYFRDANNGFVFGNSTTAGPDFWRTSDGGITWQQITNFPLGGSWYHMDFVSQSVGFMGSNGAVVKTTDGGATWNLVAAYPQCPVIYGMDFRDAQVGIAGGNRVSSSDGGVGIFKSTDGGANWVRKFPQSANDVLWLDNTTVIATVGTSIYRSTDAGETWALISSELFTGLFDMELLADGTIVGVSGAGDGWRSTDGGFNWRRTLEGIGALPSDWAVSFFDSQTGSIVGQSGLIYRTTDGGVTWTLVSGGMGGVEFRDIEMFNDTEGLAVGDNGYFLRTGNGGSVWEPGRLKVTGVVLFRNESLYALSIVDSDFAAAAGYDGVVYKTFDRGRTWQSIGYPNLPGEYFINDVKFITRSLGYVTGNIPEESRGTYRTTDGGATWQRLELPIGHTIDAIDANRVWIMNAGGSGYRTEDGGATWQEMILPNQGFSPTISKIDFVNENEGWAVGWYGYAAHTIDGGRTWQLENIASQQEHILSLHALSPTEVVAVGAPSGGSPYFYYTNNAGATWSKTPLANQYSMSGVFATASRKIWTSGYDGAILHNPNFTATAPALLLTLNPTRVIGGGSAQGTVRVASPAPSGGRTVALSSNNSSLVGLPSSVTIPGGATEASFNITTQTVSPNSPSPRVTVTAASNGNSDTADLVVAPATSCTFSISPEREDFGASGGVVTVRITAPAGCNWTSTSGANWITFSGASSGTGSGTVTVSIARNTVNLTRFQTIQIAGKSFFVNQAPAQGCDYALSAAGQTFGKNGGAGSVTVNTGSGCAWTARSNAEWITLNNATGQGSATIGFTVAANPTSQTRSGTFTVAGRLFTIIQKTGKSKADFDRDGKTDVSVFRPSNGEWWINRSSTAQTVAAQFGLSSDKLVPADYTGDGQDDIAFFRPASGEWFILRSDDASFFSFPFGQSGDVPVTGDFDADGRADPAVFRPGSGEWFILKSAGGIAITTFGTAGDVPVPADYDGDGRDDIAIFRPSNGQWWLNRSSAGIVAFQFGSPGDKAVAGDYTGDGKADVAVWRPTTGIWYVLRSENSSYYAFPFGQSGDLPTPGDYDGDGKWDAAVFRPSNGTWYAQRTTAGTLIQTFGQSGDEPVPNVFIP